MKRTSNIAGWVVIVVGLLFQWGCAVGPKYEDPAYDGPNGFRFASSSPDSVVNLKWWELFDDPVLDTLVKTALQENKDLLIAASRVEQARANLGFNKADYYPKFYINAGATRGNFVQGLQLDEAANNYYTTGQLNWELDFWGKFRRANEAAKAELMSTEYAYRGVQMGIISEVVRNYFLLLDYTRRHEIAIRTTASRDSALDIIEARFDKGTIPEIDVNQAQIQKAISQATIPIYQRQIVVFENNLSILMGEFPHEVRTGLPIIDQEIPPDVPSGIPASLLERRPDLLSIREDYHAQHARIGVAQAMRLPAISLTGVLGAASQELSSFGAGGATWSIGGTLVGPLFEFGKNKRRVEVERELAEQALLNYENTALKAFSEVERSLNDITALKEELVAREDYFRAASNASMLSHKRYDKGVTSYLEVLENQRSAFESELLYTQTYQELLNAYVNLYLALGGGWVSQEEMNGNQ